MSLYEQISLFPIEENPKEKYEKRLCTTQIAHISEKTFHGFNISAIPFIGCNFDCVYPTLAEIIPKEKVSFCTFPFHIAIICEIICAAICHQINWDFLRSTVYNKTMLSDKWLSTHHLSNISESEVNIMLSGYDKPERIRANERAKILRDLGRWLGEYDAPDRIFMSSEGMVLKEQVVRRNLLKCMAFAGDPEEKKMQLLMQKLSVFDKLNGLRAYCQPAIDYHLVRVYLRRGLLIAKNKYAMDFLTNFEIERKESTMAAVRQLCSCILSEISGYTHLDMMSVNQIEWHIGRSVCAQDKPDCFLLSSSAQWLKERFSVCPFFKTCLARYNNRLLNLREPTYKGISY